MTRSLSMNTQKINITKMTGEITEFDESRLIRSLEKSGANEATILSIAEQIKEYLYDGISTKAIYKKAFALLKKHSRPTAARYKLKKAITELGPTGYPFEKFIGEILKSQGFKVDVGVIIQGHCLTHEIDVIANKDDNHYIAECKFHTDPGRKSDVKVPLYIKSRFEDVDKERRKDNKNSNKTMQGWIYTNTRFTSDALKYGECAGLSLVSWDTPEGGSLREIIDRSGLHPITSLTSLTRKEKQLILEQDIVMSIQLCNYPEILNEVGIKRSKHKAILNEANQLCRG